MDLSMPFLLLCCNLTAVNIQKRSFGAILQHNEDPLPLLGVYSLSEEYNIWVFQFQQKIDLSIDHLYQLFLLHEIFFLYFLEPEDLYCLGKEGGT